MKAGWNSSTVKMMEFLVVNKEEKTLLLGKKESVIF